MNKVFISTTTFGQEDPSILGILNQAGVEYTLNPHRRRLNEAEISDILHQGNYHGLLAGLEPLTHKVLAQAKQLKVISRVGVGLDNVDQAVAESLGIKVYNTPGVLTDAVAELTLGLMLAALRKIALVDRKMHQGVWEKQSGSLLKDKTVGLVGFGSIGQRVAKLVTAFGARIIFCDVQQINNAAAAQESFLKVIQSADIISLHSSSSDCIIGEKEINECKAGVIIVNTARGRLIDEAALLKGLAAGKIGAAALDVFNEEPYHGPLCQQDNVILTTHIGSYAKEARVMMEKMAIDNLCKGLQA